MSDRDVFEEAATVLGIELPLGAQDRLVKFEGLLRDRAVPLGLVAVSDLPRLRERHLIDCLRAIPAVERDDRSAYDLGSGAGLPGAIVAIGVPELQVALVERRPRRAAFLELVVESLRIANASVLPGRVEDLREPVDLCFARAFASPAESWRLAAPLLRPGGRLVYFGGERFDPSLVPAEAALRRLEGPVLESSGPVVIMGRQ